MEHLWAPWRMSYITQPAKPKTDDGCFLCAGIAGVDDRASLIVHRSAFSCVVLNRYPYNNGHLLIAPLTHQATPADLNDEQTLDIQKLITKYIGIMQQMMKPDGFNVGLNLGKTAGAGLPGHLHWHVVPRWNGDNNFMPVISDTRIISQSLDALFELMRSNICQ